MKKLGNDFRGLVEYCATFPADNAQFKFSLKARSRAKMVLDELIRAGATGCTVHHDIGGYWSRSVNVLRKSGVRVQFRRELIPGESRKFTSRFVLLSQITGGETNHAR